MSRKITKETRGASVKKFFPTPEVNNGLCLADLTDIEVTGAEISEESNMIEFRGMTVPRINFIFTEKVAANDVEPAMYFQSYIAYPHEQLYDRELEWKWDTMAQTFKHFIDVLSGDDFKEEYADLLDLNLDDGGTYTAEEQVKAWNEFFKGVQTVFKGRKKDSLPVLEKQTVWMKLLVSSRGRNVRKNGDFALSGYPGDGLIELYKEGILPTLRINVAKGESIIPKDLTAAANTTGGPAASANPAAAAKGDMPSFMAG